MTERLRVDGVILTDALERVFVDGVAAKVEADGVLVYEYDPVPIPDLSTSGAMPDGISGVYYSYMATNTGGAVTTWSASGLPTGLSINSSIGLVSGVPSVSGPFTPTITATNISGFDDFSDTFSVAFPTVAPDITTSDAFGLGFVGGAFSWTPTNTGDAATSFFIQSGVLPNGLSINPSTGVISGTPTTVQTQAITVRAVNAQGSSDFSGSISISRGVIPTSTLIEVNSDDGLLQISFNTVGQWFAENVGFTTSIVDAGNYTSPSGGVGSLYEVKIDTPIDVSGAGSYSYLPGFGVWSDLGTTRAYAQSTPAIPGNFYWTSVPVSIREIANPSNVASWSISAQLSRPS